MKINRLMMKVFAWFSMLLIFAGLVATSLVLATSMETELYCMIYLFGTLMIVSLLSERVFGYTKQNERYRIFCYRAVGCSALNHARKNLGTEYKLEFSEEFIEFYNEFYNEKTANTVSDGNYLLSQVEKLINKSKA